MNHVFVLCAGRCGSTSFAKACKHIRNYTAGHESRTHLTGPARLAYPSRHIEVDNRLSWLLGRLECTFGDRASYVHLIRDPEATARSFLKRADRGILLAYRTQILMGAPRRNPGAGDLEFCRDYVGTVTANIRAFLRDKPRTMVVRLEEVATDFPRFWDWIGAEGDAVAAQAEWEVRHNASP